MALRYDRLTLDRRQPLAGGDLGFRVDANLTRCGIFTYKNTDGSERREYRPADEVFKSDSMATFAGLPVTLGHPGLVTKDNWQQVAVGHICDNIKQDGQFVCGQLAIVRADAVAAVDRGEVTEVSLGYHVDIDNTPGETSEGRYDCVQRNLRGNHAALIPRGTGRAGPDVRLRLDSNGDEVGYTPDVDKSHSEELTKACARADAAEARIAALETELAEAKDVKRFDAAVEARVSLIGVVVGVLGSKYSAAGKTDRQIKQDAILVINPKVRLDGRSDDYIDAMFDATMAFRPAVVDPSLGKVRADAVAAVAPPKDVVSEARERNAQASRDAWKTGRKASTQETRS